MIGVIIAGGSGTRLWPLSTPDYPKHLLTINGSQTSLLQNTAARLRQLTNDVYVISEAGHSQHVQVQLPELAVDHFIIEPARRGTASCVVAALALLAQTHDPEEVVLFSHADHFIRDVKGFERSFKLAAAVAQQTSKIVLVGVEPDYPSVGFGYIEKGAALTGKDLVYHVRSFKEKPDHATAVQYLKSGRYLWNAGYFVGTLRAFMTAMKTYAPNMFVAYRVLHEAAPSAYTETYLSLENVAIDYALIEKVPNLLVVPASFDWMDLGSFGDLHKAVDQDERGNYIAGAVELDDVENSFIQNDEAKPVAVIGLDNIVVINTPHGVLIARKDLAQRVGDISKKLQT